MDEYRDDEYIDSEIPSTSTSTHGRLTQYNDDTFIISRDSSSDKQEDNLKENETNNKSSESRPRLASKRKRSDSEASTTLDTVVESLDGANISGERPLKIRKLERSEVDKQGNVQPTRRSRILSFEMEQMKCNSLILRSSNDKCRMNLIDVILSSDEYISSNILANIRDKEPMNIKVTGVTLNKLRTESNSPHRTPENESHRVNSTPEKDSQNETFEELQPENLKIVGVKINELMSYLHTAIESKLYNIILDAIVVENRIRRNTLQSLLEDKSSPRESCSSEYAADDDDSDYDN